MQKLSCYKYICRDLLCFKHMCVDMFMLHVHLQRYVTITKADITEGVNVDGENLTNLRLADDVALFNETTKQMKKHLNSLNSESMKVGLKIHKGQTKYMTNHADSEEILVDSKK